jgi:uncharacterized membrane protein
MYLRVIARHKPSSVVSYLASDARTAWVETMMASPNNAVAAVQTLRNTTMAATFLASTAVLMMIGIMTLLNEASGTQSPWHMLNLFGALAPAVWLAKILSMLIVMFFAFFCFSSSIRSFNHVGYMINARNGNGDCSYSPGIVANELNRGGRFYSLGTRAYYFLVPLACWLFGPLYLVVSTVVLILLLLPWVDRVHTVEGDDGNSP